MTIRGIPTVGLAGSAPDYVAISTSPENAVQQALANEAAIYLAPSLHGAAFGAPIILGADRQGVGSIFKHHPILDFSHLPLGTPYAQLKQGVSVARPELRGFGAFCGKKAAAPKLWFGDTPAVDSPDFMPIVRELLIIDMAARMLIGGTTSSGGREFEVDGCRFEGCHDPEGVALETASSDGWVDANHAQGGRYLLTHASIQSHHNKAYGYWGGPAFTYGNYAVADDLAQDGAGNGYRLSGSDSHVTVHADSVGVGTAGKDSMSCVVQVDGPRNTVRGRAAMRAGRGGRWVRSPDAPNGAFGTMHYITYGPNAHDCDIVIGRGDESVPPFASPSYGGVPATSIPTFK